jgi:hypothetical protein
MEPEPVVKERQPLKRRVRPPEMAEILSVSLRTLQKWRPLLPYEKIGRVLLYDPEEVLRAVSAFKRRPGKKAAKASKKPSPADREEAA